MLVVVYGLYGYRSMIRHAFRYDSDYHWTIDCLDGFCNQKMRFPENWEEMHAFAAACNMYPSIPSIEERIIINFRAFSTLNKNRWNINCITEDERWIRRFKNQNISADEPKLLNKYCEELKLYSSNRASVQSCPCPEPPRWKRKSQRRKRSKNERGCRSTGSVIFET